MPYLWGTKFVPDLLQRTGVINKTTNRQNSPSVKILWQLKSEVAFLSLLNPGRGFEMAACHN